MSKYVFLTNSIGGISGGSIYVKNKVCWLQEHGWEVIVFDTLGLKNYPIEIESLKQFNDNRISALFYAPSLFLPKQKNKILSNLVAKINPKSETIVVESNGFNLSLWGELLAKEIKAKHIVYIIGENKRIDSKELFDFYYFKYQKKELFAIKKELVELLFSKYTKVSHPEHHVWTAGVSMLPENIHFEKLDTVEKKDFNILCFGRYKRYFPSMIESLADYVRNSKSTFNIAFLGLESNKTSIADQLKTNNNATLHFWDAVTPLPMSVFNWADVVIAAAGCARIAYKAGAKTVSMDVETHKPIGVLGYTTNSTVIAQEGDVEDKQLKEILEDVLSKQLYNDIVAKKHTSQINSYEYHMSFVNNELNYWDKNVSIIKRNNSTLYWELKIAFACGLEHLVTRLRFLALS